MTHPRDKLASALNALGYREAILVHYLRDECDAATVHALLIELQTEQRAFFDKRERRWRTWPSDSP
jgi:hypothetical protein